MKVFDLIFDMIDIWGQLIDLEFDLYIFKTKVFDLTFASLKKSAFEQVEKIRIKWKGVDRAFWPYGWGSSEALRTAINIRSWGLLVQLLFKDLQPLIWRIHHNLSERSGGFVATHLGTCYLWPLIWSICGHLPGGSNTTYLIDPTWSSSE